MKALPVQLREALVEAELDDPVVLRSFPRASLSRLGVVEGGHRAYAYEQALGTGDVVGDTSVRVCESPTASDVVVGIMTGITTMVQLRLVQMRLVLLFLVLVSPSEPAALGKERAESASRQRCLPPFQLLSRLCLVVIPNFPEMLRVKDSVLVAAHQLMAPGPVLPNDNAESHPIEDALALCWTLVDQCVLPPGYEEAFRAFATAWMVAAERDDERKASWNNVSAAAALAAQRKMQEDKVLLDAHSRDQFLLAAVQSEPSSRGYCTKEPPRK